MVLFSRTLPMLLNTTLDAVMPVYRELFQRHGVTEQQWRVLRVLWSGDRITSRDLSRQTLLPGPSLVGILDRLEKKGLVTRVRSENDRRKAFVTATKAGRDLQEAVMPAVEEIHAWVQATVDPAAWQAMEDALVRIAEHARDRRLDQIQAEQAPNITA